MKVIYNLSFFIILLVSCTPSTNDEILVQVANPSPALDSLEDDLDSLYERGHLPGFAVAIFDSSKIYYQQGFGYADVETQSAYTPTTVQLIASISKTLIGVSLMKAVESGYLNLDDDVNDYLPFPITNPKYPNQSISLRHLATHTSGLADPEIYAKAYVFSAPLDSAKFPVAWHNLLPDYSENDHIEMDVFLEKLLSKDGAWFSQDIYLEHAPGTFYEYSNIGATLLAYIIQIATKEDYRTYTEKHILAPLGMKSSTWKPAEVDKEKEATYYLENQEVVPDYHIITYPDGGLYSSVSDLTKFLQEMMRGYYGNGTLLSNASYQEMMRKQFASEDLPYGLTWDRGISCCIGHGGNDFGTSTMMYFQAKSGLACILFSNISLEREELEETYYEVFNTLFKYDLR